MTEYLQAVIVMSHLWIFPLEQETVFTVSSPQGAQTGREREAVSFKPTSLDVLLSTQACHYVSTVTTLLWIVGYLTLYLTVIFFPYSTTTAMCTPTVILFCIHFIYRCNMQNYLFFCHCRYNNYIEIMFWSVMPIFAFLRMDCNLVGV